ncbi:MAG: hypothetical protein SEPTF4163_002310 [Sporothrix epigloea]
MPQTRSGAESSNSGADNSETDVAGNNYDIGALLQELIRRDEARAERERQEHTDLMRAILSLANSNRRADSPSPPVVDTAGTDKQPDATKTSPPQADFKDFVDTGRHSDNLGNTWDNLPLQPVSLAFSNEIGPIQPSHKSLRDVQLDFDWYVINGYRENCEKPVDERLVGLVFPPLVPSNTIFGNEPVFDPARHPKDRVTDMPMFTTFNDPELNLKLEQAQAALEQRSVPVRRWASYVAPRLRGDFHGLSRAMNNSTPWYRCVFAIICQQGLQAYCNDRESKLVVNVNSTSVIDDMRKLADALYFAPLLNIDGLGRLDMFISSVATWDSRMASKLRMELKAAIPHRYIDGPQSNITSRLLQAPGQLVAAASVDFETPDVEQAYYSDGGSECYDKAYVTSFEKSRQSHARSKHSSPLIVTLRPELFLSKRWGWRESRVGRGAERERNLPLMGLSVLNVRGSVQVRA